MRFLLLSCLAALALAGESRGQARPRPLPSTDRPDWLVDPSGYRTRLEASTDGRTLTLTNDLIRRTWRIEAGAATIALDNLVTGASVLRSVRPEARVVLNGTEHAVGGLLGQRNHAFLRPSDLAALEPDPGAMRLLGWESGAPRAPFEWKRVRHCDESAAWPPRGVHLRMDYGPAGDLPGEHAGVVVEVHYEMYDGLPCYAKWIRVRNEGPETLVVDRFTSEILAAVEAESRVEWREGVPYPHPNLWVETDYATGGAGENGQRWSVHWVEDPLYSTQVNYLRKTPCLLECRPGVGPAQDVRPGDSFTSFKTYVLVHDSEDRARNGLARCRMYRTIAPWTTENPLMMHVRRADEESVTRAIEQCAEVGFEMLILTFGSGFDIEDTSPANLARMERYAELARSRGVEIGGYSLLSSRRIGDGQDVVPPPGESPTHGSCPALTSEWGQAYYRKLYDFFPRTGFSLLEHDGPYPGDFDVTPRPPLQKGYEDSQWVQFWIAADFYRWCRGQGIYLNTPDWYHLNGSTKSAMGYREVNWSLPRADQVLHTRQNIYDGTWNKTPTMGWMFVPLTEYHGGGAAATVEPLHEHLDHYRRILESNLGAGVQACYRGPRLFDTDQTREMLRAEVEWFRAHRAILESDLDHGASRRADGRDLDWMLHVNPRLTECGLLVVHNPLDVAVERRIPLDLYYTGLTEAALVRSGDGRLQQLALDRRGMLTLDVRVEAGARSWYSFERPTGTSADEPRRESR